MYHHRLLEDKLAQLFRSFPIVVVSGARQVGKSTLLKNTFPELPAVVFDPVQDIENARQDPELFLNFRKPPVILDEIQYAPELVAAIKRRIDRQKIPGQYLLTGSQQWGVLKNLTESLAGRAVFLDLHGFCLSEIAKTEWSKSSKTWLEMWLENPEAFLKKDFSVLKNLPNVYEQIWRGFLPDAQFLNLDSIPDFYFSYQRTYIERDVRLLGNVSDWQMFGNFLRLIAALSAQEINHSQLGRELGITPQTSSRWLDLLKATFQWFEIPAYSGNTLKRVSLKPKGYIADTGLACLALAISTPQAIAGHPLWGNLFETAVATEMRKLMSSMRSHPTVYHWRSHGGAEIDLLLERNGKYYPIEIKAKSRPDKKDISGLDAFRKTYPQLAIEKGLVICPCEKITPLSSRDYAIPWNLEPLE